MPRNNQTDVTKDAAARVQSSNAKSGNDPGFAARAQSAADKHANGQAKSGGSNTGGSNTGGNTTGQGKKG